MAAAGPNHEAQECPDAKEKLEQMLREGKSFEAMLGGCLVLTSLLALAGTCFYAGSYVKPRPPLYWDNRPLLPFFDGFHAEVDVTQELREPVQRLLNLTTKPECMGLGRDGAWATHKGFRVTKVVRIENGRQWTEYANRRWLMSRVKSTISRMSPDWAGYAAETVKTVSEVFGAREADPVVREFMESLGLDEAKNERLMFHGSPIQGARNATGMVLFETEDTCPCYAIKHGGFDERLGSVKGMYGSGCYFADMSSKADQYGGQYNPPGVPQGSVGEVACLFLARVALGVPYKTNQSLEQLRRPPCIEGHFDLNLYFNEDVAIGKPWRQKGVPFRICDHQRFDSVLGDLVIEGQKKLYREYVIYDKRAYPEFCVTYERIAGAHLTAGHKT